jgi:hypothetical protein
MSKSCQNLIVIRFCVELILAADTKRVLKISPSATKITGAKLTLAVGTLRQTNDAFVGEFQMKVSPFFFKNEKGIVTIDLSTNAIAKAARGETIEVKGVAKTSGKNGPTRPLTAVAIPKDSENGSLTITIQDGDRKLRFVTDYRFQAE